MLILSFNAWLVLLKWGCPVIFIDTYDGDAGGRIEVFKCVDADNIVAEFLELGVLV